MSYADRTAPWLTSLPAEAVIQERQHQIRGLGEDLAVATLRRARLGRERARTLRAWEEAGTAVERLEKQLVEAVQALVTEEAGE